MLYTIIVAVLLLGLVFGIFSWIGWVVGVFNRELNSNQRTQAGMMVTVFFLCAIVMKGCEWSRGSDRLEEKRGNAFRSNNPGYYDINSPNAGNARPDSYELIQAQQAIKDYDDKMARSILLWIGAYLLLAFVGYVGEEIIPLKE